MRVFISGPITKGDRENKAKIQAAKKVFKEAQKKLEARGYDVVNPFELGISDGTPWSECMRTNISYLMSCDGIHMLPGWHESEGALLEHTIASKLKFVFVK